MQSGQYKEEGKRLRDQEAGQGRKKLIQKRCAYSLLVLLLLMLLRNRIKRVDLLL